MAIFTEDMAEALRSSEIVRQLDPKRLEVCHAGPVERPADQLADLLRAAESRVAYDGLSSSE